ncbi:hypothetical protein E4Z66_11510 [Aliishimia ponticola]|uniref:Uncharacterized protein n=1 Tax=Aliishimia ponticola TaxID=2499833 RepID=A0A4S4NCC6_9RHOB|nr:hypothetical protein [Aliishimia ponticola]THH35708.1 hypothetical protein E4Z66_11510 [Aliishimia ponticola]
MKPDIETLVPGNFVLRAKDVHVANTSRSGLSEKKPPAGHSAGSVVRQKPFRIRIAPRFCATLFDMSALDLVDRTIDRIPVILAPAVCCAESLQAGVRRPSACPERVSDVRESFPGE